MRDGPLTTTCVRATGPKLVQVELMHLRRPRKPIRQPAAKRHSQIAPQRESVHASCFKYRCDFLSRRSCASRDNASSATKGGETTSAEKDIEMQSEMVPRFSSPRPPVTSTEQPSRQTADAPVAATGGGGTVSHRAVSGKDSPARSTQQVSVSRPSPAQPASSPTGRV